LSGETSEESNVIDTTVAAEARPASAGELPISTPSLVVLVGVAGSGKSTFAARHFAATEVLSSDFFRGMVADDENDQRASADAFELLYHAAHKRLAAGRLTVVDATNVHPDARADALQLAREHDLPAVAIVLDIPLRLCRARNAGRPERVLDPEVLRRQRDALRRGIGGLADEGFDVIHRLTSPEEVDQTRVVRIGLPPDLRHERGPFDIIGDVHGCRSELEALLAELGYLVESDELGRPVAARHPDRRRAVFVGDLVDRGPDTVGVLRLAMSMVATGDALVVPGNHEHKLLRVLRGQSPRVGDGLARSLAQLATEPPEFRAAVERFLGDLVSHYVLDGGELVVAHAGLPERMHGRVSERVRKACMYGQMTGETDGHGLPVRYPWVREYRGRATVVYGHTAMPAPLIVNNTICLDTGCAFGGRLTALRYPERDLISVPAARVYHASVRPFPANPQAAEAGSAPPDALSDRTLATEAARDRPPGRCP
jgi:protein phosphatase